MFLLGDTLTSYASFWPKADIIENMRGIFLYHTHTWQVFFIFSLHLKDTGTVTIRSHDFLGMSFKSASRLACSGSRSSFPIELRISSFIALSLKDLINEQQLNSWTYLFFITGSKRWAECKTVHHSNKTIRSNKWSDAFIEKMDSLPTYKFELIEEEIA